MTAIKILKLFVFKGRTATLYLSRHDPCIGVRKFSTCTHYSLGWLHLSVDRLALILILPLLLCSCANQVFYGRGKNAKGADVAIPTFRNYGDMVGNVEMSPGHVSVKLPDGPIPYADYSVTDGKGKTLTSRVPVMPGIYNSTVNNGNWAGAAKVVNEVGSMIFKAAATSATGGVLGAGVGAIPK